MFYQDYNVWDGNCKLKQFLVLIEDKFVRSLYAKKITGLTPVQYSIIKDVISVTKLCFKSQMEQFSLDCLNQ